MKKMFALLLSASLTLLCTAGIGQEIKLNGDSIEAGEDLEIEGTTVTITEGGTYTVSGTLTDGRIVIKAKDCDVTLELNGADITCSSGAAIYISKAEQVKLITLAGTENHLSDTREHAEGASGKDLDSVIYSKADVLLSGEGSLTVDAHSADGINCRDTLTVTGGSLTVSAARNGIIAKDAFTMTDGTVSVDAVKDGIKATNDRQDGKGILTISGGSLYVSVEDNALRAITSLNITGGTTHVETMNNAVKCKGTFSASAGTFEMITDDDGIKAEEIHIADAADVTLNGMPLSE